MRVVGIKTKKINKTAFVDEISLVEDLPPELLDYFFWSDKSQINQIFGMGCTNKTLTKHRTSIFSVNLKGE